MDYEVRKPIPFARGYIATSYGRIFGLRGKELNPTENYAGYLVCDLHKVQFRVNRIICITFHGEPPTNKHHAAHKDSNKWNNREDNLYWATPLENAIDLSNTGRNKGNNSHKSILTEDEVKEIRRLREDGYKIVDIHSFYPQVEYVTIQAIIHNRSWKHLL